MVIYKVNGKIYQELKLYCKGWEWRMYQQLIYPERAEDLKYNEFIKDNYKIFLDHWEENIKFLKNSYEKVFSTTAWINFNL